MMIIIIWRSYDDDEDDHHNNMSTLRKSKALFLCRVSSRIGPSSLPFENDDDDDDDQDMDILSSPFQDY